MDLNHLFNLILSVNRIDRMKGSTAKMKGEINILMGTTAI